MDGARRPIIVVEGRDINIYRSADEMSRRIEAIDVAHGAYRFFDSRGCELAASVGAHEAIQLTAPALPCDDRHLRSLLLEYLYEVGLPRLGLTPAAIDKLEVEQLALRYLEWASSHGFR